MKFLNSEATCYENKKENVQYATKQPQIRAWIIAILNATEEADSSEAFSAEHAIALLQNPKTIVSDIILKQLNSQVFSLAVDITSDGSIYHIDIQARDQNAKSSLNNLTKRYLDCTLEEADFRSILSRAD